MTECYPCSYGEKSKLHIQEVSALKITITLQKGVLRITITIKKVEMTESEIPISICRP